MASLVGKWQLYSSENFEDYMKAIGVAAAMVEKAKTALSEKSNLTVEYGKNGDEWTVTTTTPMGEKTVSFKLGQEFETTTLDGRTVKVVQSLDGDTLVETQTGDGFTSKNTRAVSGGDMVATMCGGGVTAVRKYKRI